MTKTIITIFLLILTFSCNDSNHTENLNSKIKIMNQENDSLRNIISELNSKYIFDSITVRDIPSYKNTYKINSEIIGEIVFVGYNNSSQKSNMNVILIDSTSTNSINKLYNSDTLKIKNGGFIYKRTLSNDNLVLKGVLKIENEYGKKYEGFYSSSIKAK